MAITPIPFAITGIENPEKIRVLIYANGTFAHAPLLELFRTIETKIAALESRIKTLEGA